jgi:hypothetical protein
MQLIINTYWLEAMCPNSLTTLNYAAFIFHAGQQAENVFVRYF